MSDFNSAKKKLKDNEEDIIVIYALEEAACGFPFSYNKLENLANILLSHRDQFTDPVSPSWVPRFLE